MQLSFLVAFLLLLSVSTGASPLGSRAVARRYTGAPQVGRRFMLQSRVDSPAACVASAGANEPNSNSQQNRSATTVGDSLAIGTTLTSGSFSTSGGTSTGVALPASTSSPSPDGNSTSPINITTSGLRTVRSLKPRFAQPDLLTVAQHWQDLCLVSGGDIFTNQPCVNLAGIGGINALLEDGDTCAQQDIADAMITFAKSPGIRNRNALIDIAIAYRKHPRNAISILGVIPSTLYCQELPLNPELHGLVNGQLDGVDRGLFGSSKIPIAPFGTVGTCPLGLDPDVSTCSCLNSTNKSSANGGPSVDNSTSVSGSDIVTDAAAATATPDTANSTTTDDGSSTVTATSTTVATPTDQLTAAGSSTITDVSTKTSTSVNTSDTALAASLTVSASVAATTAKSSGPNFQPSDISGDVNDTNG